MQKKKEKKIKIFQRKLESKN